MSDFILSAFADEAAKSLYGQIEALRRNGISHIELRNIEDRCVVDFSDGELAALHSDLERNGIRVSAIASPIGKIGITEEFEPHFERFRRAVQAARALETRRIRMFSFFLPKLEDPHLYRGQVLDRLRRMCAYANENGVRCCHENEKEIYGDIDRRVLELHRELGNQMDGVFDPANFVQCGVRPADAFPELEPYIDYLHVKDALFSDGSVTPAGQGDGELREVLRMFHRPGKTGLLTLEPHLFQFGGLTGLQTETLKHRYVYDSANEAFDAAAGALKQLLREEHYSYE